MKLYGFVQFVPMYSFELCISLIFYLRMVTPETEDSKFMTMELTHY